MDSHGNRAIIVDYTNPISGQTKTANIAYDTRGLPIFDDFSEFTTTIDPTKSYTAQMRQATRDLREAINSGKIDSSRFTPEQIKSINSGSDRIKGYTWHHNAQSAPNSMQLVPKQIHDAVSHTGQAALSKGN